MVKKKCKNTGRTHFKKGDTWERRFGRDKAIEMRERIKSRTIKRNLENNPMHNPKIAIQRSKFMREWYRVNTHPMLGKKHKEESKIKISGSKKGVSNPKTGETRKRLFKEGKLKPSNYIDGRSKWMSPARYGDDWEAIRYLVYLRDKFTCQDCGINGKSLDIHHKIPFLFSGDNSLNNLITLCRKCHMKAEHLLKTNLKQIQIEVKSHA